jgi:hypothetical protein
MLDQSKLGNDPKQQRSLHPATSALRRKHLYPAQSPLAKNDITDDIMQCSFFSFFKPSSNARAFPPHRLRGKPLTETPRHGEKLSTGTPPSSSASAPHSNDTAATPPNPVRQNGGAFFALAGFKGAVRAIKHQ